MEGCQLAAVYHFSSGGYLGKHLNGLTMVVVGRPRQLIDGDKKRGVKTPLDLAIYLPKGITAQQERNLKFVLVEHQTRFAWGTMNFRSAPIAYRSFRGGYSVRIPGVFDARTHAMTDRRGKPRIVTGVPFEEGSRWQLGKTSEHRYTDPKEKAWHWSYPANNGAWCEFAWDRIDHG